MKTRFAIFALALLLFSASAAMAQQRTEVQDRAAARRLLGRHLFSLQWISWDHFGRANVTLRKGVYSIKGEQKGRGNTDFVTIEGEIERIKAREFTMNGTITTQVSHINNGGPCVREGTFTFRVTGTRKYWRLQEMQNPCDGVTDYVDIYFR
ncbi:MAG: hypothetical protein KF762_13560 [Acidobacteria bacterium]|nr:hypothetical protein [Acidobacteriota bacterium]